MKKVKSSSPQRNLKQLFLVLTQSKKSLSAYTAHTITRIKWHISNQSVKKKLFFNSSPKVAYLQRLYSVKIPKTEAIENLTLGTFNGVKPTDGADVSCQRNEAE